MNVRRRNAICAAALATLIHAAAARAADPLTIETVEGQPLAANVERLLQALDYLGHPLAADATAALRAACGKRDAVEIQRLLDAHVLLAVSINPESRVRVERGPSAAGLQQAAYTPAIVKVVNHGGITHPLRITSPSAGAVYGGEYSGSLERQQQTQLRSGSKEANPDRFLQLEMFTAPPMTGRLSGLEVEYALALIYSGESGKREATIGFDVDQGTQDLGFRGEAPVLFTIRPAARVVLRVHDTDGAPTTARFVFRDESGHVHPPQPKRLAPDLFFQPHIYRADGESVLLPPGELTMEVSRGPEYHTERRQVTIPAGGEATIQVTLKRWIDPPAFGYYGGDHHIHAAGCAHYNSPSEGIDPPDVIRQVKGEGLNVGCVLNWGFCYDYQRRYNSPAADAVSEPLTVIKYDIEVSGFGSASMGHVCLLNLKEHQYPGTDGIKNWPTWATPTLRWAKQQGAFTGYPHSGSGMQIEPGPAAKRMLTEFDADGNGALSAAEAEAALLPEPFARIDVNRDGLLIEAELARSHERIVDQLPNLGIPEAPLEICAATALGVCDFTSAMDTPRLREWNTWYHLMNSGFPLKLAGETDFPCMSGTRVGQGRTYVHLGPVERIDFHQWCEGLARGRSYVSDGYAHAVKFSVAGAAAGDTVLLEKPGTVEVTAAVAFSSETPLEVTYGLATSAAGKTWTGDTVTKHAAAPVETAPARERVVEVVVNGQPVARRTVAADDQIHELKFSVNVQRSSWIALRQLPQLHTNPVVVTVAGQPIRASRASARWCAAVVEQLARAKLKNVKESERASAEQSFREAAEIFRRRAAESPEGT